MPRKKTIIDPEMVNRYIDEDYSEEEAAILASYETQLMETEFETPITQEEARETAKNIMTITQLGLG